MKFRACLRREVSIFCPKYGVIFLLLAVLVLIFVLCNMDFLKVTLVHPSEAFTVLRRLSSEHPYRLNFQSLFRSDSISETTTCNVCLHPTQQPLCNYTDLHTGKPWFCYKPKKLSCDMRIRHYNGEFKRNLKAKGEQLFQSGVNRKVSIQASGPAGVTVLPEKEGQPKMKTRNVKSGLYYYQGVWRAVGGTAVQQFTTSSAISQCLKDLKKFNQHSLKLDLSWLQTMQKNILVTYRCHGPLLWFTDAPTSEVYIRRLQSIHRLTIDDTLIKSDWYALQLEQALRAVFKGLNVHLVDAWEMTLAHHLPHNLHPEPPIIKNMINVLL